MMRHRQLGAVFSSDRVTTSDGFPPFRSADAPGGGTLQTERPIGAGSSHNLNLTPAKYFAAGRATDSIVDTVPRMGAVEPAEHAQLFLRGKLYGGESTHAERLCGCKRAINPAGSYSPRTGKLYAP